MIHIRERVGFVGDGTSAVQKSHAAKDFQTRNVFTNDEVNVFQGSSQKEM